MMERLRAMREPLKYVQGRDALLKFQEEMGYMGHRWLFVCSNTGKIYIGFHDVFQRRRYNMNFAGFDGLFAVIS